MKFTFSLARRQITEALGHYQSDTSEMRREHKALQSGGIIAGGDSSPNHLETIINWKSSRPKTLIMNNDPHDIRDALRVACAAPRDRTAVAVLCGLHGVGVPMASAFLTAINPLRFTIIDWRALKALAVKKSVVTIDDYLEYLAYCRTQAERIEFSLRDLDRALWVVGGS